jgi:hypothetical protein
MKKIVLLFMVLVAIMAQGSRVPLRYIDDFPPPPPEYKEETSETTEDSKVSNTQVGSTRPIDSRSVAFFD